MDGIHRLQDETGIHPEEIAGLPDGRWLVLFLLLYVRDGDFRIDELAERLGGLGFGAVTSDELYETMQRLKDEGLVEDSPLVPDGDLSGSRAGKKRFGLTVAGESYLQYWGDSLEQYGKELGHFLHLYRASRDAHTSPATTSTDSGREGRDGAGTVFVLT
jgi:DNA-binding PadR family transcriptional regulator